LPSERNRSILRGIMAAVVIGLTIAYPVQIFRGKIQDSKRLKGDDIALVAFGTLVCALLLRPQILERLTSFEVLGLKMSLDKVKEEQQKQARELAGIRFVIPLLIPDLELAHLRNMLAGATNAYKGSAILRDELMHLRSIGLIQRAGNRGIRDVPKDGSIFDLADYVKLTDSGREWLQRISAMDAVSGMESQG